MVTLLVNSPFQVLCAWELLGFLEARRGRAEAFPDLRIVDTGQRDSYRQALEAASRLGLEGRKVGAPQRGVRTGLKIFRELRVLGDGLGPEDTLVVGDPFFHPFADVLTRSGAGSKWVVDDGVANWTALTALVAGRPLPDLYGGRWLRRIAKGLLVGGVGSPRGTELQWFSLFARYVPDNPHVYPNGLERLRKRSRPDGRSQEVWFLGAPLVSAGIVTELGYAAVCRAGRDALKARFGDVPIRYLRHRREAKAEARGAACFEQSDESSAPIELRWLDGGSLPQGIAGVFSTALFSLAVLCEGKTSIIAFWPSPDIIAHGFGNRLNELKSLFVAGQQEGILELDHIGRERVEGANLKGSQRS